MIIKILGCHGSELTVDEPGGRRLEYRTCGFLINDTCMMDAGTVSAGLQEADLEKIKNVIISHVHFDHIKGLSLLADNMAGRTRSPIDVWGLIGSELKRLNLPNQVVTV